MKAIVIGLGSMGRRRIRLLKQIDKNIQIKGIDLSLDRQKQAFDELGIESYSSIDEAVEDFNPTLALVCTSPISHGKIVLECLKNSLNVFTEINLLSDWYDEALKLANENNLKLFISSTFLYRKEIEFLKESLKDEKVNYIYHIGQYLPDWHPWESYKNFFVANPKTNGCREIFAIDMPWILDVFGEIDSFSVIKDKLSNLEIDYNDNYFVTIKHKNGSKGVFVVDIVSRKAGRNIEIYNENLHITWNGTPDSLKVLDLSKKEMTSINLYNEYEHDNKYCSFVIENAYADELRDFISMVEKNTIPKYSFEKDKKMLEIIDEIEK